VRKENLEGSFMRLNSTAVLILISIAGPALAPAQGPGDQSSLKISLPGKPWALQIDAKGFTVDANETKPDGRRYFRATNKATGIVISATMEQTRETPSIEGCQQSFRDRLSSLSTLKPVDVERGRAGDIATLEFILAEVNGIPIRQKNVFGCLVKENVFVDIHLSKVQFAPRDQSLFTSILGAVHFTSENVAVPASMELTSKDYLGEGSKYYMAGQYEKAIAPYRKALDLERKDRKLELSLWRVLVDNMAIASGITGDLASAEEVVRYGLSKDPEYPLFHYILANVYAEKNDLDNTIKSLTTALKYRQNAIPGEKFPDPRLDDSFKRFLNNDRFRKLLDSF
jgi:hypothetical protein